MHKFIEKKENQAQLGAQFAKRDPQEFEYKHVELINEIKM